MAERDDYDSAGELGGDLFDHLRRFAHVRFVHVQVRDESNLRGAHRHRPHAFRFQRRDKFRRRGHRRFDAEDHDVRIDLFRLQRQSFASADDRRQQPSVGVILALRARHRKMA